MSDSYGAPQADGLSSLRDEAADASSPKASIPSAGAGIEVIDLATFHQRLKAQGVPDRNHNAFVCPVCDTVQSMASLVEAGASPEKAESVVGFSCEGRLTGAGAWPRHPDAARRARRGCDWSLGGLFRIHQLEVHDEGRIHPLFNLASPYEAQKLAQAIETRSAVTAGHSPKGESVVPQGCAQGEPSC